MCRLELAGQHHTADVKSSLQCKRSVYLWYPLLFMYNMGTFGSTKGYPARFIAFYYLICIVPLYYANFEVRKSVMQINGWIKSELK